MSSFTEGKLEYEYIGKDKGSGRKLYRVLSPFSYKVGRYDKPFFEVRIERGFVTDFASLPWPIYHFIKQDGPWAKAACVHDKLLKDLRAARSKDKYYLTRLVVDAIFYEALMVSGVKRWVAYVFYVAVRFFTIIGYGWGLLGRRKKDVQGFS